MFKEARSLSLKGQPAATWAVPTQREGGPTSSLYGGHGATEGQGLQPRHSAASPSLQTSRALFKVSHLGRPPGCLGIMLREPWTTMLHRRWGWGSRDSLLKRRVMGRPSPPSRQSRRQPAFRRRRHNPSIYIQESFLLKKKKREGDARGKRYGDICICITDSLCYKAETNTPL